MTESILFWPLFWFVLLTGAGQFFAWRRPQRTKKFWVCTDYFWLAIAAAGVIGAAGKLGEIQSRDLLAEKRSSLGQTARQERSLLLIAAKLHQDELDDENGREHSRNEWMSDEEQQKEEAALLVRLKAEQLFIETLADRLITPEQGDWLELFNSENFKTITTGDYGFLDRRHFEPGWFQKQLDGLRKLRKDYDAAKLAAQPPRIETFLIEWSPILLGLALAVRFGKVSAELRGYLPDKKSELPRAGAPAEVVPQTGMVEPATVDPLPETRPDAPEKTLEQLKAEARSQDAS
ncbi:MAG TPA: hypothetical protein VHY91_17340 [Pirellulales bacterium]|jgi:hypothetical protein|nr:hypothetical protein [Pirellulales bacterium]